MDDELMSVPVPLGAEPTSSLEDEHDDGDKKHKLSTNNFNSPALPVSPCVGTMN